MAILDNDEHPLNTPLPMIVTEEGISTCANDVHPLKTSFPILVTEEGIVI